MREMVLDTNVPRRPSRAPPSRLNQIELESKRRVVPRRENVDEQIAKIKLSSASKMPAPSGLRQGLHPRSVPLAPGPSDWVRADHSVGASGSCQSVLR